MGARALHRPDRMALQLSKKKPAKEEVQKPKPRVLVGVVYGLNMVSMFEQYYQLKLV